MMRNSLHGRLRTLGMTAAMLWVILQAIACQAPGGLEEAQGQDRLVPGNPAKRYTIGGQVINPVASSWVKLSDGPDTMTIDGSNKFTFKTSFYSGTAFKVTLVSAAPGTGCKIDNGIASILTDPITNVLVTCGPTTTATSLVSGGLPGTVSAGQTGTLTVSAYVGGIVSYDYTGKVKLTSTDPNAILPPPYQYTANDGGVHDFNVVFNTAGAQTVSVTDGALTTTAAGVQVGALAIYYLNVTGFPSPVTAGQQGNVTLTARDKYGNVATSYTGKVHLTSSDPLAVLPADYTFAPGDAGIASLPVTLETAGLQWVKGLDLTNQALPGSQNDIFVNPNTPAMVLVTGFPSPVVAGSHWPFSVTLEDAYGNLAANTTDAVTFVSSDTNAQLPAGYRFTTSDGGSHTFDGALVTAGIRYIRVVDANRTGVFGQESNILVNPNVGVRLAVRNYPQTVTAGQNANVWLTIYDAYNNVATSFAGSVTLRTACPNSTISPNVVNFTPSQAGNVPVPVVFTKAGTCALTGNSTVPLMSATQGNIVVSPNVATALRVANFPSPTLAGAQGNVTVTAYDAYANVATGFTDAVYLTSSDFNAVLSPNRTYVAADMGVAVLPVILKTAGIQAINANDVARPAVAGQQGNILVVANNANHFLVNNYPNPAVAGQQGNLTITAFDDYNNIATNYTGTVYLMSADPNAVYPASVTMGSADGGVVTTQVTLKTAGTWALQANDYTLSYLAGGEFNILVNPNVVTGFSVTNYPSPQPAGVQGNVVVTAYDAYGNVGTSYTGTVYLHTDATVASMPANRPFTGADAGVVTLPVTFSTAGTWSLMANDLGTPAITGAQTGVVIGAGNANHFGVVGFSTPIVAGTPNQVIVTAYDMYNNIVLGYVGQVHFTSHDPLATLPGDYSFTGFGSGADNGNHTFTATLATVGAQNIIVTDTLFTSITGNQNAIMVTAGNANYLRVTSYPNPTVAGVPHAATVTAYDAYGNVATGYSGTVRVSATDPNFAAPADTLFLPGWSGSGNITVTLVTAGLRNINANDTGNAAILGRQLSVLVIPANANGLVARSYPSPVMAGQPNTIVVTAYDAYANVVTNFNDAVTWASADPNASLPGAYTFTSTDAGVHSFNATLRTVGNQNLVVRDATTPALAAFEPNIVVTSAAAVRLSVTGYPAAVTAGQQANITITAYDAYNNIATGYTGQVAVSSSDPNAALPGNANFVALNAGVLQEAVALTTVGTQKIQAVDTNITAITGNQNGIVVSPNAAVRLTLTNYPSPVIAGTQGNMTVTAYDAYGNIATGYAGTVHFFSTDPNAALSPNTSFAGKNGVVTVAETLQSAGAQSLSANDMATPSIAGMQNTVVVSASSAVKFLVKSFPTPVVAGQQGNVTVIAYDGFGNIATGYTGTVAITSSDTGAILPANQTYTSTNAGVGNFTVTLTTSGNQSINANDTSVPGIAGNQNMILVNPNVAVRLKSTGFPNPATAGVQGNITVTAYDAYGNLATGYTGTVRIRSTDPNAVVPADYVFPGNVANANLPVTLTTAGTWAITGNDTVNTSLRSSQRFIVVNPNSAVRLTMTGFPATSIAGQTGYAIITAYDANNNVASGYTGTVHVTSTDTNGAMPPDHVFVAADAGITSVPVTLKTTGNWTLQANDTVNTSLWAKQVGRVVSPNVAATLRVTGFPATVTAGQQNFVVVTAYDAYGNIATSCTDAVHVTSTDPNAALPYDATFSGSGNVVMSVTLRKSGTWSINANDTSFPSTIFGSQTGIIVNPNVATYLVASNYPSPVFAGQQANVVVKAYDAYNNLATGYTGTVALSSTDPNAVLQGNYTFTGANAGNANLSVTFKSIGNQNIVVKDIATPAINGNQVGIVVNPNNGPLQLYFAASPGNANVCSGAQGAVVQIRDMYNNIAVGNTNTVTLGWTNNPNSAWLQGAVSVPAVKGIATFSGLGVNKPGRFLSLSANATGIIGASSGNFNTTNVLPAVTSINLPTNSNTVATIGYYLSDVCADNANVKVEVWTTGINAYSTATQALGAPFGNVHTPSNATARGNAVSFSWDNSNALRSTQDTNVWVRMTPTTRGATGPATLYGPFTVDNRLKFSVTLANTSNLTFAGAAVANLDHDAYPDIAVTYTNGTTKTGLFNGTSFDPVTASITLGAAGRALALSDLNRDGYTDVVSLNGTNAAQVNWLTAGANSNTTTLTTGTTPTLLVTGDINMDGYPDIVVGNAATQNLTVFFGASGGFQTAVTKPLPNIPTSMVASDVDRDGKLDLIIASSAASAVYVLINDGSGYFATRTVNTFASPATVQVVDADRNGTRDLAVLTPTNNTMQIYSGDGNGFFSADYGFYTVSGAVDLKFADFDSDGFQDAAVLTSGGTLAIHRGVGSGNFANYQSFTLSGTYSGVTPGTMRQMLVGDFDLDGRSDLFVGADTGSLLARNVIPRRTTPNWGQAAIYFNGGSSASSTAVADVNRDGISDVVAADPVGGKVALFRGGGDGTLTSPVTVTTGANPNILIATDLNHDHISDFLATNYAGNSIGVWLGSGSSGLTAQTSLACGGTPTFLAAGDLNMDGHTDVVVTINSTNSLLRFLGNGDGTFGSATSYSITGAPSGVALGDLNSDGLLDVVVTQQTGGSVTTMFGTGTGAFQSSATYTGEAAPQSPMLMDLNGDGILDVLTSNSSGMDVFITNSGGSLQAKQYFNYTANTRNLVGGDWDHDGYNDVAGIIFDSQNEPLNIVYYKGSTTFSSYERRSSNALAGAYVNTFLTTGDLNGDGWTDIVTADGVVFGLSANTGSVSVLLNNASGSQTLKIGSFNPGSPQNVSNRYAAAPLGVYYMEAADIVAADVDRDGILDIVQAQPGVAASSNGVNIFVGSASGGFSTANNISKTQHGTIFASGTSVAVADFDRDGWVDIMLQNESSWFDLKTSARGMAWNSFNAWRGMGGQSQFQGMPLASDYDRNGTVDLVTQNLRYGIVPYSNDGNGTLTQQTVVASCNLANASGALGAICTGDFDSNAAPDFATASGTAACVNLTNGSGTFTLNTNVMSNLGSSRPVTCAVNDVNRDGKPDIVYGNSLGSPLLLLGNGDGTFAAASAVPAASTSLAVLVDDVNNDGKHDVVYELYTNAGLGVALGNGDGTFKSPTYLYMGAHFTTNDIGIQSTIIAADFDRDGRKDLAVLSDASYLYIIYGK